MPEVISSGDVMQDNSYRYEDGDWPSIPPELGQETRLKLYRLKNKLEPPTLWGCLVNVADEDKRTWSFLVNICKIANSDIKNFDLSSQDYATKHTTAPFLVYEIPLLRKVAHSWDLLLRLRLICDVAIIMWANSPRNSNHPTAPDKMDSIGTLLKESTALYSLGLGPDACAFLKVLNDATNRIKHPTGTNDWVSPEANGKVMIARKGVSHLIAQPVLDLVLGTNRFLIAVLCQIKL